MHHDRPGYIISALNFLTASLLNCDLDVKNVTAFNDLLDEVKVCDLLDHGAVTEGHPNADSGKKFGAQLIMMRIIQLFDIVTAKDKPKNGLVMTSRLKTAVYSAMQAMLRFSIKGREVAEEEQLFSLLQERLDLMHKSIGISCNDFIRKFGNRKKEPIVEEMGALLNIICAWYEYSTLLEQSGIDQLIKNLISLWPWTEIDANLRLQFINCLIAVSEDSIPVCMTLSQPPYGQQHSLLKRIVDVAMHETVRVKAINVNLELLRSALRVMINCSSCVEGRVVVSKLNALDVFTRFHPAVTKGMLAANQITELWLEFWEVFSRYAEGNQIR